MVSKEQYEKPTIHRASLAREQYRNRVQNKQLRKNLIQKINAAYDHRLLIAKSIDQNIHTKEVKAKMKLHDDLSYLGFEVEPLSRSPSPDSHNGNVKNARSDSKTSLGITPSVMENWVRRSFSLRNFKHSSKKSQFIVETPVVENVRFGNDGPPTGEIHRISCPEGIVVAADVKSGPSLSAVQHRRRNTIKIIYELADGAIDEEETLSNGDGRCNSWTSELTTIDLMISKARDAERFASQDVLRDSQSWTSELNTKTLDLTPERKYSHASEYSQSSDRKWSCSSEDTIRTPELMPKPLTTRRLQDNPFRRGFYGSPDSLTQKSIPPQHEGYTPTKGRIVRKPLQSRHQEHILSNESLIPKPLQFRDRKRISHRAGLMPKPLVIHKIKIKRMSDTSSCYSNETLKQNSDSDSRYETDSAGSNEYDKNRLRFYQTFFNNRSLMRCLDSAEDEILAENMYSRLLEETKHHDSWRGELEVRKYWDDVRAKLRDEVDEIKEALPSEGQDVSAWLNGEHGMIDDVLERYGPEKSPIETWILSSPSWCSPWTSA